MLTIPEIRLRINNSAEAFVGEWGVVAIIVLLGLVSFGLGRLSALEDSRPAISIEEAPTLAKPQGMAIGGLVVASWSGSVYYYPWCSGTEKILPANRRWFADETAAKAAGYAPAKNCKGLQ